jgi:hypothetical protein
MPTRILREGIISSERVNQLSERAELFYRKLMSVADDYGRFFSNPISLLGACYPLRTDVCESDVKQFLSECVAVGLVAIYGAGKYLVILEFRQQTRSKSKFPEPTESELLIKCVSNPKQMLSLGGVGDVVEGVGGNGAGAHEIPSELEAVKLTMTAGIPEAFSRYIYQDWSSRAGKDAGGVIVNFLPYVTKRWAREQVEWKSKTHKGTKTNENSSRNSPKRADRNKGTLNEGSAGQYAAYMEHQKAAQAAPKL